MVEQDEETAVVKVLDPRRSLRTTVKARVRKAVSEHEIAVERPWYTRTVVRVEET